MDLRTGSLWTSMFSIWISDLSGTLSILRSLSYYNKKIKDWLDTTTPRKFINMATYLFLETEGDASDGALQDALHEVGGEAGNLVSKSLGLDDRNVVDDSLIYMEVVGQPTHHAHKW